MKMAETSTQAVSCSGNILSTASSASRNHCLRRTGDSPRHSPAIYCVLPCRGNSAQPMSSRGGKLDRCENCAAGPLRVFDLNADGHPDILGSFDSHSVFVAFGPIERPRKGDVKIECRDKLPMNPGESYCMSLSGMGVAQLDAARLEDDVSFAVAAGCISGHSSPECRGTGELFLFRAGTQRPKRANLGYLPTEIEILGGTAASPEIIVSGAPAENHYCSTTTELITFADGRPLQRQPLYDPIKSFALDIELFWTPSWSDSEEVVYKSSGPHLTIPGAAPIRPRTVHEGQVELPPCPNKGRRCWTWERRSSSVHVAGSKGFTVETAHLLSERPDLVVSNAIPGAGVMHLVAQGAKPDCTLEKTHEEENQPWPGHQTPAKKHE